MNVIDQPAPTPPSNPASSAMPRRQFLATTALATSFSIVAPAAVFGAPANSKVTVGLIGVGGRGSWIADYLAKHGGFEIFAIADYFQPVAESAGTRFNVPKERCFSGLDAYKRLLAAKPDAVFLEVPPYFFPIHAQAAVEAGCHVYMAKPVAVDVPGCLRILEAGRAATRKNKVFLVDFQTRTDPWHIEGLKKVHGGLLGKVGLIQSFYHDDGFPDPAVEKTIEPLLHGLTWCNDNALGGAYMVNCDIHAIDVGMWIANELPECAAGYSLRNRLNPVHDSHDTYAITFHFKSGTVWSHYGEHVRNNKSGIGCIAYGQSAFIECHYSGKVFIRGSDEVWEGGESTALYADGMQRNVQTFHRSITEGIHTNPTLEPSVNSTLASLLAREAALRQTRLTWAAFLQDQARWELDLTGLKV
ncbi:MAG: Gfo/Idh/MocA family oxidoreductase [Verrucomicrobiota bacterium]